MDKLNISTLGVLFSMLILPALGFAEEPAASGDSRWTVNAALAEQVRTAEALNRALNGAQGQGCSSRDDCRYRFNRIGPSYSEPKSVILGGRLDKPNKFRVFEQDQTKVYVGQGRSGAGFRYLGVETRTAF